MSLTDKIIKNTYYYIISQVLSLVISLIMTPVIISFIGKTEFGIYALVLGITGIFGLFDFSLSNSYIKFISEYYNKKDNVNLNAVINTAMLFYLVFSAFVVVIALYFMDSFLNGLNIPPELMDKARFTFYITLVTFSLVNIFSIFNSVLISLQKMYIVSIYGLIITFVHNVINVILLYAGFGLEGIVVAHMIAVALNLALSAFISFREVKELRVRAGNFSRPILKQMVGFGMQTQVSKFASFLSDKYDEFLLAFFSVISSVTYYNVASRVSRAARLIPLMFITQIPPVAAEFQAKENKEKIRQLFEDTSRYLSLITLPVFLYVLAYAHVLITAWMGPGFESSVMILRLLALGQIINIMFSAPGTTILTNIGLPKYLMWEGLILLAVNLVLSYYFIRNYGILGAAIGNTSSVIISSLYIFISSFSYFKVMFLEGFIKIYLKPFLSGVAALIISAVVYFITISFISPAGRYNTILITAVTFLFFITAFSFSIHLSGYLNERDKDVLLKMLNRVMPFLKLKNKFVS